MITVRRQWLAKNGQGREAIENVKAYREKFGDPTWRVTTPYSGVQHIIAVDEDYDSLVEAESKWAERTTSPEFGPWLEEWKSVAVGNSLEFNFFTRL